MTSPTDTSAPPVTPALRPPASVSRLLTYLPHLILILGLLARILRYAANRSLWGDEAMLSLDILDAKTLRELTEPLGYNQGAPIGFLFAEKLVTRLLGPGEYALRLLPFLAGIAGLVLFYFIARRLFAKTHPLALALAVALFAFGEPLVYYASEVKQYSSDVAMCLLIILLALRAAPEPGGPLRQRELLTLVGALALWFSHAVTFVLAGAGLWLLILALPRQGRFSLSALLTTLLTGIVWTVSFTAHYFMSLRTLGANQYLLQYWKNAGAFMPPPTSLHNLKWFPQTVFEPIRDLLLDRQYQLHPLLNPAGWPLKTLSAVVAAFAILGLIRLIRRDRTTLLLLTLPLACLILASALGRYPMRDRLVLWTLPLLILFIAQGIAYLHELYRDRPLLPAVCVVAIIALPLIGSVKNLISPPGREELRPVLAHVAAAKDKADVVYFLGGSEAPARYYMTYFPGRYSIRPAIPVYLHVEVWDPRQANLNEFNEYIARSACTRVWIVTSSLWYPGYLIQEARVTRDFDAHGTRLDETHAFNASAYLYELDPAKVPARPIMP